MTEDRRQLHGFTKPEIKLWGKTFIIILLAVTSFGYLWEYGFNKLAPVSHWVEYDKIEPRDTVRHGDENIPMVSYSVFHRDTHIVWIDSLWCRNSEVMPWHPEGPSHVWREHRLPDNNLDTPEEWTLYVSVPDYPRSECKVVSSMTIELTLGIHRHLFIESPVFKLL